MGENAVVDVDDAVVEDVFDDVAVVVDAIVVVLDEGVVVEDNSSDAGPHNATPGVEPLGPH